MSRAICAVVILAAAPARAEPRTDPTEGRAVFTGATSPSATSIDVNPAALGLGSVDEIYTASTLVLDHYSIQRRMIDLDTGALSPGASVRETEPALGGMLAAVLHYKDNVALAVALRTTPVEAFPSGQSALAYFTLGGAERVWAGTAAAGFKLTDELHFGVSLGTERRYLHLRYARDTALAAGHNAGGVDSDCGGGVPCGVENPAAAEIYDVNVQSRLLSQDAFSVSLGLVLELAKDTFVGVAYHTTPGVDAVENSLTGDMTVTTAPRSGGIVLHGNATVNVQEPASVDAEVRTRLPDKIDLHVGFRWEDLSRFSAYDVRGYGSTFANVPEWTEIPRGFHDPFAFWAGIEQAEAGGTGLSDGWRFGGRFGIETASLDDARTSPMTIDPLSYTADAGAMLRLPGFGPFRDVVLQATYGLQYYPAVHVTQSAFDPRNQIACIESNSDYSTPACEAVRLGYALPTGAGDYSRIEQAFRIALRLELP
jgi:hypothetical protein